MIHPNEIRRGNLLQTENGSVFQVRGIFENPNNKDECYIIRFDHGYRDNLNTSNCSGIPLTEEWLVKLGFEYHDEGISSTYSKSIGEWGIFEVTHDTDGFWAANDNHSIHATLKSIHQLQNLYFALTGEELTLKT